MVRMVQTDVLQLTSESSTKRLEHPVFSFLRPDDDDVNPVGNITLPTGEVTRIRNLRRLHDAPVRALLRAWAHNCFVAEWLVMSRVHSTQTPK